MAEAECARANHSFGECFTARPHTEHNHHMYEAISTLQATIGLAEYETHLQIMSAGLQLPCCPEPFSEGFRVKVHTRTIGPAGCTPPTH